MPEVQSNREDDKFENPIFELINIVEIKKELIFLQFLCWDFTDHALRA